ncbi:hypothetical protein KM043_002683 [Ampulex compressa]|nr:hypothetical protein KM043_002683 [Ampulex compressa]
MRSLPIPSESGRCQTRKRRDRLRPMNQAISRSKMHSIRIIAVSRARPILDRDPCEWIHYLNSVTRL